MFIVYRSNSLTNNAMNLQLIFTVGDCCVYNSRVNANQTFPKGARRPSAVFV